MRRKDFAVPWSILLTGLVLTLATMIACSKNGADGDDVDEEKPYTIFDLSVDRATDSSIILTWTASGDDNDEGKASSYDVRYAKTWITVDNWDEAIQVMGEPMPRVAGVAESLEVVGLYEDSTYYFALKVCDEAGNCANPSNCVQGVCFVDAPIVFADDSLEAVIRGAIDKPTGQLMRSDVAYLTALNGYERGIESLEGIAQLWNLRRAWLSWNAFTTVTPLQELTELTLLTLDGNTISDISPLAGMDQLSVLNLSGNQLSDLSALTGMSALHDLGLRNCGVVDLTALVDNLDFADNDSVNVSQNPLSEEAMTVSIPALRARGVTVTTGP